MEATGHYWLALYCFLRNAGYQVHVVNPIQSDAARNLYIRKSKTDQKDASILADLRRALRLAASSAYRFNPEFTAYYASKRKEGKLHKVVIGAIARRLVHLIYSVWSQERLFESDYQWTPIGSENQNPFYLSKFAACY